MFGKLGLFYHLFENGSYLWIFSLNIIVLLAVVGPEPHISIAMIVVYKLDLILVLYQKVADCLRFWLGERVLSLEVTGAWITLRAAGSSPRDAIVPVKVDTVLLVSLASTLVLRIHVLSFL